MGCCNDSKLSCKQWMVLAVIGSVHFTAAICVSLQAPFYPEEAESKNATATQYGFVFGIYELVSFLASPILGNFIDAIGAKLLLNCGILTAGICSILFGLLDFVPGPIPFISLSLVIRGLEAVGSSAAVTSAFAITAATFPDNMATTFATLEIFYGMGYVVGPILGGVLFSFGGYMLPFIVMGVILLMDAVFIYFVLPSYRSSETRKSGNLWDILKIPAVVLDAFSIIGVSVCMGYYSATLEPHIRIFHLSALALGFVFVTHGGTYALIAPWVGRLCDRSVNPRHMILTGCIMVVISVTLVGPSPFLPYTPSLPLVLVGLVCLGLGMATVLVSAFTDAIRSAVSAGFPDDISTYALVSGLWASSFALGDFIGPSVGGVLIDWVGFRWGTLFIVALQVIIFSSMCIFVVRRHFLSRRTKNRHIYITDSHYQNSIRRKELEPLNPPSEEYGSCRLPTVVVRMETVDNVL